jgi:hypothetical protein
VPKQISDTLRPVRPMRLIFITISLESVVSRGHGQERNCIIETNDIRTRATQRSE